MTGVPLGNGVPPLLVLVSGCPGSGKTTLARLLGEELRLPVISRDRVRDGIWTESDVWRPGGVSRRYTHEAAEASFVAFYGILAVLLRNGVSVIGEHTFRRGVSEAELAELLPLGAAVVVHCQAVGARERFLERVLGDPVYTPLETPERLREMFGRIYDEALPQSTDPPALHGVPVLRVDTTGGYRPAVREIADWAWRGWSSR